MSRAVWFAALLLTGCVTDRVLELEVRPPRGADGGPDVPADVVSWELWLERLADDEGCGTAEDAAAGRTFGELAAAQTFSHMDGMGMPFGELPSGRWSLRALARTAGCEVRLYGCTEVDVGAAIPDRIVVPVAPVAPAASCGCRTCERGECSPLEVCPNSS